MAKCNHIVCIIACALTLTSAQDPALSAAHYFKSLKKYHESALEFKRYVFFHPDDSSSVVQPLTELSDCYKALGDNEQALAYANRAIDMAPSDSIRQWCIFDKINLLLIMGKTTDARIALQDSIGSYSDTNTLRLYYGLTYLYDYDWEHAKTYFLEQFSNDTSAYNSFKTWLTSHPPPRQLTTTTMQILSAIVPCAGMLYCGEIKKGLTALILNSLTGYACVAGGINKEWADVLLYGWLFSSFYAGNIHTTGELAAHYNQSRNNKYMQTILKELSALFQASEHR
jgi:tetratricopeptide (TPR) repeat protein